MSEHSGKGQGGKFPRRGRPNDPKRSFSRPPSSSRFSKFSTSKFSKPSFGQRSDRTSSYTPGTRSTYGDRPRFSDSRFGAHYADSRSHFSRPQKPVHRTTSWNDVAQWYDDHLSLAGTYHSEVVLPNLVRLINPRPGMRIVELGAGQGFFCREFAKRGAITVGVELSEKLVEIARTKAREENVQDKATFVVAAAEKADVVKSGEADVVLVVLALQNMKFIDQVCGHIERVLKDSGKAYIVLNHPMFRIPKQSSWGYDNVAGKQYRRVDRYMSELEAKIDMRPGLSAQAGETVAETISFHRPLSAFVSAFTKKGLVVSGMEEWISNKESQEGPRKAAEDTARKEIPLFMCLILSKISK